VQQAILEVRDLERGADRPDEDCHDVAIDERKDVGEDQNSQRPTGTGLTVGQMSITTNHDKSLHGSTVDRLAAQG